MPGGHPSDVEDRVRLVDQGYSEFREFLDRLEPYPEVQQFGRGLLEATLNFGESELLIQLGEKESVLGGARAMEASRKKDALALNKHGIGVLNGARRSLVKGAGKGVEVTEEDRAALEAAGERFRRELVKGPLKPNDARQIYDLWEEMSSAKSLDDLADKISARAKTLAEARGRKTRGTESNVAFWKLAAAAAIVGISVWGVICCNNRSCWCPTWMMALANIALAIALTAIWFC